MSLIKKMKNFNSFTEREQEIRRYIMQNPEKIANMSSRELGIATYSSAASITRFCKKLGCKGYPDFKIQFTTELKLIEEESTDTHIQISNRETIVSVINKLHELEKKVLTETKKDLSLEQIVRISKMLHDAHYIDFYVHDINAHLAQYCCNQFFHCGKIANTYTATNTQGLLSLMKNKDHLAIIISQTGENSRLIEIAKNLRRNHIPTIVITIDPHSSIAQFGNEVLFATAEKAVIDLKHAMFSTSVKYLLDIMFYIVFSQEYEANIKLNQDYEKIGRKKLWALLRDV